ncbi:hypothetical protein OCU04_010256 [Sclerotinia nivalis]|uniref:Uncharacterized protein n=1 Tax=Sclerotinia nivalis TaxID=352851 RepID=A0A9X0AHQ4_9HELO|nr:hypothetical protein OCU04_010256 [Sclerotinia nivalis]
MNAHQELERAGIMGATIAPGNSVTVIHQQHVPPTLFNRIRNLEQANKGLKTKVSNYESRIAALEHSLKIQTSHVQALEFNQKGQTASIQNLDNQLKCQDTQLRTLEIGRKTQDANTVKKLQHQDLLVKEVIKDLQSAGQELKSQEARSDNQERELKDELALYQTILLKNQERELNKKFALYESKLFQKFKQMILAEVLSLETQTANDVGGKAESRIKEEF